MKKGVKLMEVLIENGKVTGFGISKSGDVVDFPLTHSQRAVFTKYYKTPKFQAMVQREFGSNILADGFFVTNKDEKTDEN
ncbi:MAG: hypothetical protein J5614_02135 [Paludibacteraceae bacterium]|nr:hypothetical protein [Paludibacteraceae bacterium]